MNQNRNNLIVVDFDSTRLDINYLKYFLQNQERNIMPYFHGTCQQFINTRDLNRLFQYDSNLIKFRSTKKDEDLRGKLCFNRIGKFGVEIYE